ITAISIPGPPGPPGAPGLPGHSSGDVVFFLPLLHNVQIYCVDNFNNQKNPLLCCFLKNLVSQNPLNLCEYSLRCDLFPQLHLIALNSPQKGGMRGISGADFLCFSQAQAIGMKGTFRAFLSSKLEDLNSIVYSSNRENVPIVNLKDEVLFDNWNRIFSDSRMRDNVSIYSFDGKDVLQDDTWPEKMMWHGSTSRGQRNVDSYCEAWRVGERALTGMASPLQSRSLLQQSSSSCSSSYIVLCVENSYIHDNRQR
uniref:Collagenase NC10/endostatin domain-containing protein n=1 Tax=Xiphophorus maculatus TaxID=8083 RepID=A0A3B5QFQ2_XIPMA